MRLIIIGCSLSILAGCQQAPPEQTPAQSTAVVMMEIPPGAPLEDMLQLLDRNLVEALEGRMEGEAVTSFLRAEAISDRLLEARLPFEWITNEQYLLDTRLRQIQSMADRVLAQLNVNAPRDTMLQDLQALRNEVVRLQQTIARGGSRAPPPLDQLLTDTIPVRGAAPAPAAPARPSGPRPLGSPVTTGGG